MTVPHWSRCLLALVAFLAAPQPLCASCGSTTMLRLELLSSTTCTEDTAQAWENPLGAVGQVDIYDDDFAFAFQDDPASVVYRIGSKVLWALLQRYPAALNSGRGATHRSASTGNVYASLFNQDTFPDYWP